jgi:hypothetical protein
VSVPLLCVRRASSFPSVCARPVPSPLSSLSAVLPFLSFPFLSFASPPPRGTTERTDRRSHKHAQAAEGQRKGKETEERTGETGEGTEGTGELWRMSTTLLGGSLLSRLCGRQAQFQTHSNTLLFLLVAERPPLPLQHEWCFIVQCRSATHAAQTCSRGSASRRVAVD